jgi:hypothetical protein
MGNTNNMAENNPNTESILAWLGTGCSVFILLVTLCPCTISLLGLTVYVADPSDWYRDDNAILALFSGLSLVGFLAAAIIGGISIYYLIAKNKNSKD